MSLGILLLVIALVIAVWLIWLRLNRITSQRLAHIEQVVTSSEGTIQQAERAASYLHNGLGTLPFPTLKEQTDQQLVKVKTEYADLSRKLDDLHKLFEPHQDSFSKSIWSRLNYQWQRYQGVAALRAPTRELEQQILILRDLINKPKYLVANQGRKLLHFTIQPSLKTTQELVDEGILGDTLASDVRHLEEFKSRLNREEFPFRVGSRVEEAGWESTKHAWQTLEAMEEPAHELFEEVQHWKGKCREIKPKLGEMDRRLDILRHCLDQAPASITDLPTDRQLCNKAQQLREVCNSPKVEALDRIAVEIQRIIDQADHQIRQVGELRADYHHLEANIKDIDDWLNRINRTLERLQNIAGDIKLYLEARSRYEYIRNDFERWIDPITASRTIAKLNADLALSERLKEQARELAERCEKFL